MLTLSLALPALSLPQPPTFKYSPPYPLISLPPVSISPFSKPCSLAVLPFSQWCPTPPSLWSWFHFSGPPSSVMCPPVLQSLWCPLLYVINCSWFQVSSKFVWPGLSKDIGLWTRSCLGCQQSKVQSHLKSPVPRIPVPGRRFPICTYVGLKVLSPSSPNLGPRVAVYILRLVRGSFYPWYFKDQDYQFSSSK